MAQVRAITSQQEREELDAAFQLAASYHCLVEEWKDGKNSDQSQKNSGPS